ncbi:hypothetical protein PSU4_17570 [Pseudonocardia sulfidoxydans NBRC 16205]|uniref:Anti-sigma-D factor RsdA sigma factor binding region domain-containing protein n=1 Tax=Pseudonocardia sulfidoxydans NBRC 16205 TaxID=1223511 RepID=A0A511DEG3_9PSEU|nr:anti-sigma-D factor RsdA [Pseudonocardia sulfidoxydans]GEL22803.1 hypothetical protein PSU4_17570 [Pseudonocardia sulfidoxydans NBRC 16205]
MSDREPGGPEEAPRRGRHRRPDSAPPNGFPLDGVPNNGAPRNGVPFEPGPRAQDPQGPSQPPDQGGRRHSAADRPVNGSHPDGSHGNGGYSNGRHVNGTGGPATGRSLPPRVPQPAVTPPAGAEDAPDLMAVQSDDALIDALARGYGGGGEDGEDDRIAAMLAAWKAEVDADPIPELVDTDTALATIMAVTGGPVDVDTTVFPVVQADVEATGPQGPAGDPADGATVTPMRRSRRPGKKARHLVPLVGAAALIVVAVTGVSIGAHGAQPGDALFGVTEVLYTETAQSRQAAVDAQAGIAAVKESLSSGDTSGAAQQLTAVEQLMAKVHPEDGAPVLQANQRFLTMKLQETPAGQKADPEAPLRDGTPPPAPPSIPGTPSTPTAPPTPGGSVTSTPSAPPTTSTQPPSTTAAPTTTQSPSGTPKPTSEGRPDPSSTTSGLGSTSTSDPTPVPQPS